MGKREKSVDIFEFRIDFHHIGSEFLSSRHFNADTSVAAKEMFLFACRKDGIEVEVINIEVWNRWANRWENPSDFVECEAELVS
jgi:3-dehydroquinate dehydratase